LPFFTSSTEPGIRVGRGGEGMGEGNRSGGEEVKVVEERGDEGGSNQGMGGGEMRVREEWRMWWERVSECGSRVGG
jgi:hypothetical protein